MSRQPSSLDTITESPSASENPGSESVGSFVDEDLSMANSEYGLDVGRIVADSLMTSQGEVLADVLAGVRDTLGDICDALDKLNKVLYNKLNK